MGIIDLEDITKTFVLRKRKGRMTRQKVDVRAVDEITFSIEAGSLVGYIGPNGAGKSTTIKMLTGVLMPTSGRVRVDGLDPTRQRRELARRIGVVFGQRSQLWWDLPLSDSFDLLRHIYRIPLTRFRSNFDRFVEMLSLENFLATPVRQLSLGQRMRGELTAALLHDPKIVFLDEPTIGLDIVAKAKVRDFLSRVNHEHGVTVLLTTHDLSDIERLCSRMLIIDGGRVIYDGDVEAIKDRYGHERTMIVDLEIETEPIQVEGARVVRVEGPRQWLRFRRQDISAADLAAAVASKARLIDLSIEEPDIEDIVTRIYLESSTKGELGPDPGP
ncbi:MAG: ATP-binding cassette domain-containing protein [Actinomycetota bacterium]